MSQSNWRKKNSSEPNNNNYYKRSKSMRQRSSNSGSPRTNRGNRDHRRGESGDEVSKSDIQYVQSQTGHYYPDVEIENLLKNLSVNETIKMLNDRHKNSYSSKVTGHTIEGKEDNKEKNKKTNGSVSKKQNTPQKTSNKETTHTQQNNQQTSNKETTHTQQNTQQTSHKETSHTQQNTQQTSHKETTHTQQNTQQTSNKETGHTQQTSHKETSHSHQTGHTQPPRDDDTPSIDDFKVFERTLTEKQLQLTNQTNFVNKLIEDYNNIKESKSKYIEELKSEKDKLELKKQKLLEDINTINKLLKEMDDQITISEKELVQQLKILQKKAEPFQTRLHH